ncbi:MAG: hypothetical protein M3Z05_07775 [Gemmatimonadota bacterium]|nr:hypothetical protein [Gemmatimonadota bacterium]
MTNQNHPHRASLTRARRELGAFAGAERDWASSDAVRLVHAHDMRGGRYLVRAQVVKPVPDDVAQLAATVVRSLHQSLDDLATRLAGAPAKFPIFESLAMYAQRARKAISRMSDEAQATIEDLQPYHEIGGFEDAPLWRLKSLDMPEAPWLGGSIRDGGTMGVNTARGVIVSGEPVITSGAFADGAIVASVPARIVAPDPKLDMFLRVDFAIAYLERGPGRGRDVVELLGDLCDHVEHEVFPALEAEVDT